MSVSHRPGPHWHRMSAGSRLVVAALVGLVVGIVVLVLTTNTYAPMLGWDATAGTFLIGSWRVMHGRTPEETAAAATRDDPSTAVSDIVVVVAAVASLLSVGLVLFGASQTKGLAEVGRVALGIGSVAASWAVVHTLHCLKYARMYYGHPEGGIDFPGNQKPAYSDFAYVAFTVGMTFQVSDTDITAKPIRRAVLQHSLLSFLFGTVILAVSINLVAGLSK